MDIRYVYVKTRAEFGKQCLFDMCGPKMDNEISPNPRKTLDFIHRDPYHRGVQFSRQFASHKAQTLSVTTKSSGMYHYEGGWPKEINPSDEETTTRFRRRVEKDDEWGPKMLNLFEMMERNVLQNSAVNIHRHYFDDMLPCDLVKRRALRTVNVYEDPEKPRRPVNSISWSPDSTNRVAVSYCYEQFGSVTNYSNKIYIWDLDNPNVPSNALETFHPAVVTEFNPRDPSVLASGLMSGQVCNWDVRTGTTPVQISHRQFGHRCSVNGVKWIQSKTTSEFYSSSSEGRAMWWDIRHLRRPIDSLIFDFLDPNNPDLDNAIGISSMDLGPAVGTKFMFGLENGRVISGSRKAKTLAEKLAMRFETHDGPVVTVDRNIFNPKVFLSVGDWTGKVWAEDTREDSLVQTRFLSSQPSGGCWNKQRSSVFYIITVDGKLETFDILERLSEPVLRNRLCEERLTKIAAHEENGLLAIGSYEGRVYIVQPTEALMSFDRAERSNFAAYIERCSRFTKLTDGRMKEMKVTRSMMTVVESETPEKKVKLKRKGRDGDKKVRLGRAEKEKQDKKAMLEKDTRKEPDRKDTYKKRMSKETPQKESGKKETGKESDRMEREKARLEKDRSKSTEKVKKSASKDKRRLKEEIPELLEHEEQYFSIVDAEKEKYEVDDEAYRLSILWESDSKKVEVKEGEKKQDEATERESQKQKRSKPVLRSKIYVQGKTAEDKPIDAVQSLAKMSLVASEEVLLTGRKPSKRHYTLKVARRKSATVKHSKVCKKICKPKVCCPDLDMVQHSSGEEVWCQERSEQKKDDESPRKLSEGGQLTYRVSGTSPRVLMKRKKKCTMVEKMPMVGDILGPLTEIADEAMKAKKTAKELRKHLYKATYETRDSGTRGSARKLQTTSGKLREKKIPEDSLAASKLAKLTKKEEKQDSATKPVMILPTIDQCAPITPYRITKRTKKQGKTGRSIDLVRKSPKKSDEPSVPGPRRTYPRISEFQPNQ